VTDYTQTPEGTPVARMARAVGVVLLLNLLSRVLGFIRDASIAARFGAGPATDAYLVAYTIPYFLQTILGMAFLTVMVPTLTTYLVRKKYNQGWVIASEVGNWTVLIMAFFSATGIALAPWLVKIMAPGFPEQVYALTVKLTRIMFLSLPFMGTGMLVTGILNAGYIFTSPALAPAVSNLVIIFTAIFAGKVFGITGLAVGTVISFAGFLLIQLPDLRQLNFRYSKELLLGHPVVQKIGKHLLPVCFSLAVIQLYLAINRYFASQLAPGSITALDFGSRLVMLPLGVFVASVTTAIFPSLAEQAAMKNLREMAHLIDRGLGLVTLTIVPAAVGLVVLREPLVQLAFQRGAFGHQATIMTMTAVAYFCLGLLAQAMHPILTRAFYALQDVYVPVVAGLVSVILDVLLSFFLAPRLGHGGLALANSVAVISYAVMLYITLYYRLPQLKIIKLLETIIKVGLAASIMGLLVRFAALNLNVFSWTEPVLGLLIRVILLVILGGITFWSIGLFLAIEEVKLIGDMLRRPLMRGSH